MKFTEHEMVFFNSITKGNDVFGIPLKFWTQKSHEEEVKKTINGLIEKGVLASETELTKMGFLPARALECYKESRNHVIINYLHIALLEQREAIVIIPLKNREYEMLRLAAESRCLIFIIENISGITDWNSIRKGAFTAARH